MRLVYDDALSEMSITDKQMLGKDLVKKIKDKYQIQEEIELECKDEGNYPIDFNESKTLEQLKLKDGCIAFVLKSEKQQKIDEKVQRKKDELINQQSRENNLKSQQNHLQFQQVLLKKAYYLEQQRELEQLQTKKKNLLEDLYNQKQKYEEYRQYKSVRELIDSINAKMFEEIEENKTIILEFEQQLLLIEQKANIKNSVIQGDKLLQQQQQQFSHRQFLQSKEQLKQLKQQNQDDEEKIKKLEQENQNKQDELNKLRQQIEKLEKEKQIQVDKEVGQQTYTQTKQLRYQSQARCQSFVPNHVENQNRKKQMLEIRKLYQTSHGIIQIGLLIDSTQSMDPYKQAAMDIVEDLMNTIQKQTQRNCNWAAVCYRDNLEEIQNSKKKPYPQNDFTEKTADILEFLGNVRCKGGGDQAEDLRGGIKQLCNNLSWGKVFRICFLICDAPAHGKNWAGRATDNHKNEQLEDALDLLIEKNIMLLCVELTNLTSEMFTKIKQYYQEKEKSEFLMVFEYKGPNTDSSGLKNKFLEFMQLAAIELTQVNNKSTKTKKTNNKNQNQSQNQSKDGALEALIKVGVTEENFNKIPKESLVESTFEVIRVSIKETSFQRNITQIYSYRIPEDFNVTTENKWQCLRTKAPFATGQVKAVYLMKKKQSSTINEIYAIKQPLNGKPYSSLQEAIKDIKTHIITKRLFELYKQEIITYLGKLPVFEVEYCDVLIFKESYNEFWIGERFFSGEFKKYNNNNNFVNTEETEINYFLQCFSLFTYNKSNFSYICVDIQGIGKFLTDPAINTMKGNLEDTDAGEDGIASFNVMFEKFRNKCQRYLQVLDIA